MCQDCEGSQKIGETVDEDETQEMESGNRSFGKLIHPEELGGWSEDRRKCWRVLRRKNYFCKVKFVYI